MSWASRAVTDWEASGVYRQLAGHRVFTVDIAPTGSDASEPLLILHGFPTSSFDFSGITAALARRRRVVTLDLLGYGLSDKPDIAYTLALQADIVAAMTAELGLRRLALLTHDMGDTVGGELLARQMEGGWDVEVTRRIVSNGSIYIEMAHLTAGQQLLLSLPDARLPDAQAPPAEAVALSLAETMSPASTAGRAGVADHAALVVHGGGSAVMPRTIRYIEERRRHQDRYTGAIETHPSPLAIVWGTEDPIAVSAMATRLAECRPGATLRWLDGIGHYPMLEAPEAFLEAVEAGLV